MGGSACSLLPCLFLLALNVLIDAKYHHLDLKEDVRRNVLLTKFAFNTNGTLAIAVSNFTVPQAVIADTHDKEAKADKFGIIGFSLSRGSEITESSRANPSVCQLNQRDQNFIDALFLVFDFPTSSLTVHRSGVAHWMDLCPSWEYCSLPPSERKIEEPPQPGFLARLWPSSKRTPSGKPYIDYVPLKATENNQFAFNLMLQFNESQVGEYFLYYHNCFNFRQRGYSDKVAVDYTVNIAEMNVYSHLSAGDIAKPRLYLIVSFLFSLAAVVWISTLCKARPGSVYRVHALMSLLVILKVLSTFTHGMNLYFLALYGHEREMWAVLFFTTHLLKGALLFATLILIGTGYTLFKNFLTPRDRNLLMIVLPLQVISNVAMVILEESELAAPRYFFWFEVFTCLDLVCCAAVLFPIVWSMRHLALGARSDGKAAFNLEKLALFRHFYMFVIAFIYTTRMGAFFLDMYLPFDKKWLSDAMVELVTLAFFVAVGRRFRPERSNPYLRLASDEIAMEEGEAVTSNGLYANVVKLNRSGLAELDELPGLIGGRDSAEASDDDGDEMAALSRRPPIA